jgi:hypothetical protein
MSKDKELVAVEQSIEAVVVPSAQTLEQSVRRYREMQQTLDGLMPDQIVQTGTNADGSPKLFRRKGYWKAIAQGFGLTVEMLSEERFEHEDDFGYTVTYRATDPRTGRSADGDGACCASEKSGRRGGIGGTEHNVRAHAHTRATNRAVSNLVAFGEVSAEEAETHDGAKPAARARVVEAKRAPVAVQNDNLEEHDSPEYIKEVNATKKSKSGNWVHKISTNRFDGKPYTCLNDEMANVAQDALEKNIPVVIDFDWGEFSADGRTIRYKKLNSVAMLPVPDDTPVAVNEVEPEIEEPPLPENMAPSADDIPF